jgi:hypothetical protein
VKGIRGLSYHLPPCSDPGPNRGPIHLRHDNSLGFCWYAMVSTKASLPGTFSQANGGDFIFKAEDLPHTTSG